MKKIVTALIMLFFCMVQANSEYHVEYVRGVLETSDDFNSPQGWAREPLRQYLNIPRELSAAVWPPPEESLSITAKINNVAIGHRKCNRWDNYLVQFRYNVQKLNQDTLPDKENIKKFIQIMEMVTQVEHQLEQELMQSYNIHAHQVVNNCGLMVLKQYESNGIASRLEAESIAMLRDLGFKAIVCKTTNVRSAAIMHKHGFIKFQSFKHSDLGMALEGEYSFWYKIL